MRLPCREPLFVAPEHLIEYKNNLTSIEVKSDVDRYNFQPRWAFKIAVASTNPGQESVKCWLVIVKSPKEMGQFVL